MRRYKHLLYAWCIAAGFFNVVYSVPDNRYIPFFMRNTYWLVEELSHFGIELFGLSGHQAWDRVGRVISIPTLAGELDLSQLSKATRILGLSDPLPSPWRGVSIPLGITGKLEGQGIMFQWHQDLYTNIIALGAQWEFFSLDNQQFFKILTQAEDFTNRVTNLLLGPGDLETLDLVRREYFKQFYLVKNNFHAVGFGDIDFYVQIGTRLDHECRVRSLKVAGRLGVVAPTGQSRQLDSPASIPFGGNGYWGSYVSLHASAEVREDFYIGGFVQIIKRFGDTRLHRVSIAGEPDIFGATIAPVHVNPGLTIVLSPFFLIDNLRDGFGLGVTYTWTKHRRDAWEDKRDDKSIPLNFSDISQRSKWSSSYFTLSAQYDFGAFKPIRNFEPIISIRWDLPTNVMGANQIVRSNKLAIGIDFVF
jgi:hypothetical protein